MNDRRGYRSGNMGPMGSRWGRDELGASDRSRGDAEYGGREGGRHEEGLWEPMRGGIREGWEDLGGRSGRDTGYGSMRPREDVEPYRMRDREEQGGSIWDGARHEMREGWHDMKETFVGKGPKGYKRSDDRIREDVCDRLARHPAVDASEVEVHVKDGEVTLTGTVVDRRMKRLAEEIVEDIDGVHDVSNHIRVARSGSGLGTMSSLGQDSRRDVTRDNGAVGTSGTRSATNATTR